MKLKLLILTQSQRWRGELVRNLYPFSILKILKLFVFFPVIEGFLKQTFSTSSYQGTSETIGALTDGTHKINLRVRGTASAEKFMNFLKGEAIRVTGHVDIDGELIVPLCDINLKKNL